MAHDVSFLEQELQKYKAQLDFETSSSMGLQKDFKTLDTKIFTNQFKSLKSVGCNMVIQLGTHV